MGKRKKNKKPNKKLPMREPVVLPYEPDIPIETINAAVKKALLKYTKRGWNGK